VTTALHDGSLQGRSAHCAFAVEHVLHHVLPSPLVHLRIVGGEMQLGDLQVEQTILSCASLRAMSEPSASFRFVVLKLCYLPLSASCV
jgi:hypothetical protein